MSFVHFLYITNLRCFIVQDILFAGIESCHVQFILSGDLLQGQLERDGRQPDAEAVTATAAARQEFEVADERFQAQD